MTNILEAKETLDVLALKRAMKAQGLTATQLASVSKVSRAQLTRILAKNKPQVRASTMKRLATGVRKAPAEISVDGFERDYRSYIVREYGAMSFRGLGLVDLPAQPLEVLFVEPDAKCLQTISDSCDRAPETCEHHSHFQQRQATSVASAKLVLSRDRIVVCGNPGSGKTTLLRWLAYQAATGRLKGDELPIYLRLPELSRALDIDPDVDPVKLVARLADEKQRLAIEGLLRTRLANSKRRCLVLLDGLDEVADKERRDRLTVCLKGLLNQYPRNRFVISSRTVGFDRAPWQELGFSVAELQEYGQPQWNAFIEKWAPLLSKLHDREEPQTRSSLENAIFSNPRLRSLAANPLVLTILAQLNESRGGALPRRRVDLYAKVVDVFLDTWEKSKGGSDAFDDTSDINLDGREFGWLLGDLALAMQRNNQTLAPRWWVADRIQDYLQNKLGFEAEQSKDKGERILRYLSERTGLVEERGLDLFAFSHRTLQEYFASAGAINEADGTTTRAVSDCLRGYFFNPQWREVIRLAAAQLTPHCSESLIRAIIDDPDPLGRFLFRGPLLALWCLSDGTTVPNRQLLTEIFQRLAPLASSRWLGITLEAIRVLDSFDGTRLQEEASLTLAATVEAARGKLSDEDFNCIFEFTHADEIWELARKLTPKSFDHEAACEVSVEYDGYTSPVIMLNGALRSSKPKEWFSSVCKLLKDRKISKHLKEHLVDELGRQCATNVSARRKLRDLLSQKTISPELRAKCAHGLSHVADKNQKLFIRLLKRSTEHTDVRRACASSLGTIAKSNSAVRAELLGILNSNSTCELRAGAARGLGRAALNDATITATLLNTANSNHENELVRVNCAWSLVQQIGKNLEISAIFTQWLDSSASCGLRRVAAQSLAEAFATGQIPWNHRVVEMIEHVLINLEEPCPHALDAIEALATAREVRRGLRLEQVVRDALAPLAERIKIAFVFGSIARSRQGADSDIDLLIIGSVGLADVSTPLRNAERVLGRRINPAIYPHHLFVQKFQTGDPFLLDVYRNEKIPVLGRGLTQKDLDDELRAMVAERLASAR